MALSSAATDLSRPTNKGTIICGKTTMSRKGRTGKDWVTLCSDGGRDATAPHLYGLPARRHQWRCRRVAQAKSRLLAAPAPVDRRDRGKKPAHPFSAGLLRHASPRQHVPAAALHQHVAGRELVVLKPPLIPFAQGSRRRGGK